MHKPPLFKMIDVAFIDIHCLNFIRIALFVSESKLTESKEYTYINDLCQNPQSSADITPMDFTRST